MPTISKIIIDPLLAGYRSANALNADMAAIAEAIENTLSRDGTAPNQMEANIDMNDNRLTNLGAPTSSTDAARLQDLTEALAEIDAQLVPVDQLEVHNQLSETDIISAFSSPGPSQQMTLGALKSFIYSDRPGAPAWLAPFRAAIPLRHTTPVHIVCVGDSITEGYPPNAVPANLPTDQCWQALLGQSLRAVYPTTDVTGTRGYYTAMRLIVNPLNWPVVRSGGTDATAAGLGLRDYFLNSSGDYLEFTAPEGTTSAKIYYWQTAGSTSFTWRINGGATTTVSTTGTSTDFRSATVSALAEGDVLRVDYVSGAGVFIDGFKAFAGDETAGIHIWDAARSSASAQDFNSSSPEVWFEAFNVIQPQLVLIAMGANDWDTRTPAQLKADLLSIYDKIDAKITGDFGCLFMAQWQVGPETTDPWDDYRTVIEECAAERDNCGFWDMRDAIPKPDVSNDTVGGLLPDQTHPGITGSLVLAESIKNLVLYS